MGRECLIEDSSLCKLCGVIVWKSSLRLPSQKIQVFRHLLKHRRVQLIWWNINPDQNLIFSLSSQFVQIFSCWNICKSWTHMHKVYIQRKALGPNELTKRLALLVSCSQHTIIFQCIPLYCKHSDDSSTNNQSSRKIHVRRKYLRCWKTAAYPRSYFISSF